MKKMKKLATALLALSCIFVAGGLAACGDGNATSSSTQIEIELNKLAITMKLGEVQEVEATVVGAEGVTYSSDNNEVATVDANGKITAVGLGKATITATAGDVKATCKISVIKIGVTDIFFRYPDVSVSIGNEKQLNAIVSPLIATDKTVKYESSDINVATVDANGVVQGIATGEAVITATTVDGEKTATCIVKVGKVVEALALDKQEVVVDVNKTAKITATITPSDAIIQDIVWKSSNEKVAAIAGGEVFGIGAGEATITATTVDGNKVAECKVTVKPYVAVSGVEIEQTRVNMPSGSTKQLVATVAPENATEPEVQWTSSDSSVVAVDETGKITARKVGTATITVTSKVNDTLSDTVEINVIEGVSIFYNDYYTPEGNVTFTAYDVNEIKYNGTALSGNQYTYENNVVTIAKSVFVSGNSGNNALTFVSEDSGDAEVTVKLLYAMGTTFADGELGTEIFTGDNVVSASVKDGLAVFDMKAGAIANVALNWEYLDAMFAYPYIEQLSVHLSSVENISGNIGIRLVKKDGTWYNDVKSRTTDISMFISRAAYNKMKADVKNGVEGAELTAERNINFVWTGDKVGANAKIKIDSVTPFYRDTSITEQSNYIYADMPTDKTMQIEVSSPASALTRVHISGQNYYVEDTNVTGTLIKKPYSISGNVVSLVQDTPSVRLGGSWPNTAASVSVYRNGTGRLWLSSDYASEVFMLSTAKTPAASQTFAAGGTFNFTLPTAANLVEYKVVDAKVNGVDIADVAGVTIVTDAKGATGVKFASAGTYRLQVRVEKTVISGNFVWTAFDMYDRQITVNA